MIFWQPVDSKAVCERVVSERDVPERGLPERSLQTPQRGNTPALRRSPDTRELWLVRRLVALSVRLIRLGAAVRRARPATASVPITDLMGDTAPSVTMRIPSYQESRRVLSATVLSAALAISGKIGSFQRKNLAICRMLPIRQ